MQGGRVPGPLGEGHDARSLGLWGRGGGGEEGRVAPGPAGPRPGGLGGCGDGGGPCSRVRRRVLRGAGWGVCGAPGGPALAPQGLTRRRFRLMAKRVK